MAETIFALSSAPGRAGIAVVRVSGLGAGDAIAALTGRPPPEARRAVLRTLVHPEHEIDRALVLFFPAPASATGEDVAEFHVHGGRAVVQALLEALASLPGLRPAERGEFTRRAVENGRLDLTQAEGLADLVDAETEAQRRQALEQYGGALFRLCEDWRARLIRICAFAEAAIDFSDEELDADLDARVRTETESLLSDIRAQLAQSRRGEIVRDGFHLAVIGPPNAGKSSLVNALARRDLAIVSEVPGTTRDVLEARLDLDGYLVTIADTAGLRESADSIEAEGVRRALARAEQADLVVLVLDGSSAEPFSELPQPLSHPLSWPGFAERNPGHPVSGSDDRLGWPAVAGHDRKVEALSDRVLTVWNKADLRWPVARDGLKLSVRTGAGLDELQETLSRRIREALERGHGEAPVLTRLRHARALDEAAEHLSRASSEPAPELRAENFRLAARAIGRITGRVDIEELLDVIFRDFCIGK